MAHLTVQPDDLYKALSDRIGELETENMSLRLLLAKAGDAIDEAHARLHLAEEMLKNERQRNTGPTGAVHPGDRSHGSNGPAGGDE